MSNPSAGVERIALERGRQINSHGFDSSRDDRYTSGELALAAMHYADGPEHYASPHIVPPFWPRSWDRRYDQKRLDDRITQLAKAGALLAAEIDRLTRAGQVRTLDYLGQEGDEAVFEFSDTKWKVHVVAPRWEYEGDDEGRPTRVQTYVSWTLDGREPTDDEHSHLDDYVHDAVRDMLREQSS